MAEDSAAADAMDEGHSKAAVAQPVQLSIEPERIFPARESGRANEAGGSPAGGAAVATAPPDAAVNPLRDALAALDGRDYATAKRLFEAVGRKDAADAIGKALAALDRHDYATAQGLFEALAPPASAAPATGPRRSAPSGAGRREPDLPPTIPATYRPPAPSAQKAKRRASKRIFLGIGLALLLLAALYAPRPDGAFAAAKGSAIAGLASAVDLVKTEFAAITGQSGREQERSAMRDTMRDLGAALTQATIRLDQIEHDYGARLDKLSERVEQSASSKSIEVAAAPAAPAPQFADVAARLDRLEKKVPDAAAPASVSPDVATRLNDIATRLDRLENRATVASLPAPELVDVVKRLNKLEKTVAAATASSGKPLPPAAPKQSMLASRADPSASNEIAKPENSKPLLRDYSVQEVQDGVAVVASRYGPQEVAAGDLIPGAGRVLRIERRGGAWVVVTSRGVIASGPAPF
ncbi:MAG: hypothetical protein JO288_02415 [Hyphomicrobiales bacterium]|nr:hypothetical protein [Hyphomicrobiales bacterium]